MKKEKEISPDLPLWVKALCTPFILLITAGVMVLDCFDREEPLKSAKREFDE